MLKDKAIIITSIQAPSKCTKILREVVNSSSHILVVGDEKTPNNWYLDGVTFLGLEEQTKMDLRFTNACPLNSYSRKNIGYLWAMARGIKIIAETDDDNRPYDGFLTEVSQLVKGQAVLKKGWINIYRLFSELRVWPRGFPLEILNESFRTPINLDTVLLHECAIQQFLADGDPDVDSVYRMTFEGEVLFNQGAFILKKGSFCPFNSQNTLWFQDAFPLLYLPSYVSFRMTDIWRSFIAQVCLHAVGGSLAFHGPSVYQERNEHVLLRDFESEIPGYLENKKIIDILSGLRLSTQMADTMENLKLCYQALISADIMVDNEMTLLNYWLDDVKEILKK